jgi:hypothetical protein
MDVGAMLVGTSGAVARGRGRWPTSTSGYRLPAHAKLDRQHSEKN